MSRSWNIPEIARGVMVALFFAGLLACDRGERPTEAAAPPAPLPVDEKGPGMACGALQGRQLSYDYRLSHGQTGNAPERLTSLGVTVHIDGSEAFKLDVRIPEGSGSTGAGITALNGNYPDLSARLSVQVDGQGAARDEFTLTACGQMAEKFSVLARVATK